MISRWTIFVSAPNNVARSRYLFVVPSSSQMYSGTGAVIFDWIRFSKEYFEFTILMDTTEPTNYRIVKKFCEDEQVELISSLGSRLKGSPDVKIEETPNVLGKRQFEFIECVSWANAAANLGVLSCIQPNTRLIYTPHWQPIETLGSAADFYLIQPVLEKMLVRSDFVFADSDYEANILKTISNRIDNVVMVHLGVSKIEFLKESKYSDTEYLLTVGDFLETRKRIDITFELYKEYLNLGGQKDLYLVGNHSDSIPIPKKIRNKVKTFGYVNRSELLDLYQEASVLISSSEYEAFGVPIAESLSLGTQVLVNRLPVLESIFKDLPGVNFMEKSSLHQAAQILLELNEGDTSTIANCALEKFSIEKTYGLKLRILTLDTSKK